MGNIYSWKTASPIMMGGALADAQPIGECLEALAGDGDVSRLKPQTFVDAAVHNPILRPCFEWDDARCGTLHRRAQARSIISNLCIVRVTDGVTTKLPAFISITAPGHRGPTYQPIGVIEQSTDMQKIMLAGALRDLRGWMTRYSQLAGICNIVKPALEALEKEQEQYDSAAAYVVTAFKKPRGRKPSADDSPTATP